ncbi:porin family protein [Ferrimonas sp. SCSIO 43195]|uniref:porin family protein n=1 Tax=Ferrimonas sp. SCSIO 43195 TaxID=2822844 RepID=UPI00207548AB|nr:porin family protein [Ferrimonas sp. SCSIO 43195]
MMKRTIGSGLVLLAMLGSSAAMAAVDQTGFYVGGFVSSTTLEVEDFDKSEAGFGAYGGYNFNEWFGLESTLFVTSDYKLEDEDEAYAAAFTIAPKFTAVINDTFSVYGKLGLASMLVSVDTRLGDQDFYGVGFMWGLGVNAALTDNLNLRLGYESMSGDLEHEDFSRIEIDTDLSQINLGLHYQF